MDKLRAIETFVSIADHGSLTAASRVLGCSPPVVVRRLAGLEAELSVRLFNRSTRRIVLTEEGRRYLERCRQVLLTMDDADQAVTQGASVARGNLVITAPVEFGRIHVTPSVLGFLRKYPEMRIKLVLLDRVVNLLEEGFDLGVRIGTLEDSSHVAIKVGSVVQTVAASPAYLRRSGTPKHPRELASVNCLRHLGRSAHWNFRSAGKNFSVAVAGNLQLNHIAPLLDACVAGAGVARFISYQLEPHLRSGKLRRILKSFEPAASPVSLLYPQAGLLPLRVRLFVDWLRKDLQQPLSPKGSD